MWNAQAVTEKDQKFHVCTVMDYNQLVNLAHGLTQIDLVTSDLKKKQKRVIERSIDNDNMLTLVQRWNSIS